MFGHLRAYNLIFSAGQDQGEKGQARVWKAKELKSQTIPILSQLLKDHKKVSDGEDPPTRPVCGASSSMNGEASEWTSAIVDSENELGDKHELLSCEELCGRIDYLNREQMEKGLDMNEVMISSLDAVALYPSLDINKSSEIVSERILRGEVKFEGVNYKWAAKYLALVMSRVDIVRAGLGAVIPVKRGGNQGRDRTIKSIEDDQKLERWKWTKTPAMYSEEERRMLIKQVVKAMIKVTFSHHYYKWGEELYRQMEGGSIGLRATGSVARAVMAAWIEEFHSRVQRLGITVYLLGKYVDDVAQVTSKLALGTRYVNGALTVTEEDARRDMEQGSSREMVTF